MPDVFPRSETLRQRVLNRRMARVTRRACGRRLINTFIVIHLFALLMWLLPYRLPIVQYFIPPGGGGWVRVYLIETGLQQSWQMFSPNPDTRDFAIVAHVTYVDGTARDYTFPQMRTLGFDEKYRRERMRKYVEIANYNQFLWPSLARYAARQCNTQPANPPATVTLIRFGRDVPPPGHPRAPYKREVFYHTTVSAEDLR